MGADQTDALLSAVQACVEKVRTPALPLQPLPPCCFNPSFCGALVLLTYCRWALCACGSGPGSL